MRPARGREPRDAAGAVSTSGAAVLGSGVRVVVPPAGPGVVPRSTPPTLSIVSTAYQVAHVAREGIESALRQTLPPLEVVLVDDGSDDGLEAALGSLVDEIVLVRQPNRGVASAKNAAVRAASGDFVVILDADDVFLPNRLAALAELATARPDLELLTTDAVIEADGRRLKTYYDGDLTFEVVDQRRVILDRNFVFGLAAVSRERLLEVGLFDETLESAEDWDAWIRLILDGARAGLVYEPLARYRIRSTSLSSRRLHRIAWRVAVLEKARRRTDLSEDERATVASALRRQHTELALGRARLSLLEGAPDARSRSLSAARTRGLPIRTRLLAGLGALAPRTAGRALRRHSARAWVGAGGIRVPR